MEQKLVLTINESCALAGCGRTYIYSEISKGSLRALKRGRSTVIRPEDLRRWLADLPSYEPKRRMVA